MFQDDLTVETAVQAVTGTRMVPGQDVRCGGVLLFRSVVTLVALTGSGKPVLAFWQRFADW